MAWAYLLAAVKSLGCGELGHGGLVGLDATYQVPHFPKAVALEDV